jgi:TM2 domain-containing membrane protein YozV
MYKIIGADGQQYGPVTADQVRRWIAERRANGQTLVQVEGTPDWKPLGAISEFAADLRPPPAPPLATPPPTQPSAAASRAGSKIPAGVFGILLGPLGIHKFILGYVGAGLITLAVTVLTCGLAWPITHVIGLVEGIVYLCKSDEDFVRTYVDGKREWF